jgi:oxygen-dependent protoporphyrinogen oxidase
MGIEAAPLVTRVRRRARALPRVGVGHRARVGRMAAHAASLPRLALCGNAQGGVGVPECIESGARAAAAVCA